MAKKAKISARSKGYRKAEKKKPFLTKKDIIWLAVIVAVIALALILFNVFYDDGSLDVKDGVAVTENLQTSLIINVGTSDAPKYYKLGEVGEIPGYTREREENTIDSNLASYKYTPEDEASPVAYLGIAGGKRAPDALVSNMLYNATYNGYVSNGVQEITVNGRHYYYMIYKYEYTNKETGVTECFQSFSAYTESDLNKDYTVIIRANVTAKSEPNLDEEALTAFKESVYLTDEQLLAYFKEAIPAVFPGDAADGEEASGEAATDAPEAPGESATAEPSATVKPAAAGESAATDAPEATEKPAADEASAAAGGSAATDAPEAAEKPATGEASAAAGESAATDAQ